MVGVTADVIRQAVAAATRSSWWVLWRVIGMKPMGDALSGLMS
jgi:hypothetical protein